MPKPHNPAGNEDLSLALTTYKSLFETYWHTMMAASVISVAPVFILFLSIQKYL